MVYSKSNNGWGEAFPLTAIKKEVTYHGHYYNSTVKEILADPRAG